MRQYVRNILIYLVALFAIIAFISLFANSVEIYDIYKNSWSPYRVNAYMGDSYNGTNYYRGTILPVFGYVIPLIISIILFIESFKKSWSEKLKIINTVMAVILFLCVLLVLLTKETFLTRNGLGQTNLLRNGNGPKVSAIASCIGGILLLFATWLPFKSDIKFIERENNGVF